MAKLPSRCHDKYCPISMKWPFWGPVGKSGSASKIALVFLECVRDEGATDQMVVGDKVARISNCISPDNSTIRAEKKVGPRPDYVPFAFLMRNIAPSQFIST